MRTVVQWNGRDGTFDVIEDGAVIGSYETPEDAEIAQWSREYNRQRASVDPSFGRWVSGNEPEEIMSFGEPSVIIDDSEAWGSPEPYREPGAYCVQCGKDTGYFTMEPVLCDACYGRAGGI